MVLDYFFDKNLVFCLEADNQEQLFDQVATLLEEREIVTPTYREALITREKSFPTGLDMEFLGKDLPNVAIPHTDIVHNLAEKVVVVRLEKPVTFHNMIAPDKEVEVSLLFFIINNSSSSQTNILAQLISHQIKSALEEELSNRGYDVHCDAVMVKDVNEDLMKGYDIFTPIAATDLGFEPGIPVIEAGPILFRIPAMSAPVFDNIEAAIKEHGLS
ncbi:PTS system transporter subunit IIA [Streptococcus pneumoniae]|nr:PTS system transporter subunit IIA [Streptococcus pneumoniae]